MGRQIADEDRVKTLFERRLSVLLPQKCRIVGPSKIIDPATGVSTERYADYETYQGGYEIPCRLDDASRFRQVTVEGQETVITDYYFSYPRSVKLGNDHRVILDGQVYEVRSFSDQHAHDYANTALIIRVNEGDPVLGQIVEPS